jgi:epimerase transport system membrane fusion protein
MTINENKYTPRKNNRIGAIVLISLFIVFIVWASLVPLAKGVVAMGTVVVDSRRQTIQHFDGGVIKSIKVREGDLIQAGDVLIELDDTSAKGERDLVVSRYMMKLSMLDRLLALQSNSEQLSFRKTLTENKTFPYLDELLSTQRKLFDVLGTEQQGKLSILMQRGRQLKEKVKGLKIYQESVKLQLSILETDIERLQGLVKNGLVDTSMVVERQQLLAQLHGELGKTLSSIFETEIATAEAKLNSIQADKEWQEKLAMEISETQETIIELKNQLLVSENVLERTIIKAPQSGIVFGLKYYTVGGVIAPANPIMDIVPQSGKIVVEVKIRPLDIDAIQLGMLSMIRLSSFSAKKTPSLNAVLDHVSADAMLGSTANEEPYYLARLSVPESEREKLNELQVLPGMPVETYFDGGSRTLMAYLTEPLFSVFRKGLRE